MNVASQADANKFAPRDSAGLHRFRLSMDDAPQGNDVNGRIAVEMPNHRRAQT
jgi:hypothetical protein